MMHFVSKTDLSQKTNKGFITRERVEGLHSAPENEKLREKVSEVYLVTKTRNIRYRNS